MGRHGDEGPQVWIGGELVGAAASIGRGMRELAGGAADFRSVATIHDNSRFGFDSNCLREAIHGSLSISCRLSLPSLSLYFWFTTINNSLPKSPAGRARIHFKWMPLPTSDLRSESELFLSTMYFDVVMRSQVKYGYPVVLALKGKSTSHTHLSHLERLVLFVSSGDLSQQQWYWLYIDYCICWYVCSRLQHTVLFCFSCIATPVPIL